METIIPETIPALKIDSINRFLTENYAVWKMYLIQNVDIFIEFFFHDVKFNYQISRWDE